MINTRLGVAVCLGQRARAERTPVTSGFVDRTDKPAPGLERIHHHVRQQVN